jgi:hypothetical protein
MKYPAVQPVMDMLIATAALPGSKMPATTVGCVVKYDPFATPLSIANTISGPSVLDTGQIASMLKALRIIVITNMFRGPSLSHSGPAAKRPMALPVIAKSDKEKARKRAVRVVLTSVESGHQASART